MNGLGFNRFAAEYLSRVKVDAAGILPQPHTPWVVNQFASDVYRIMSRNPGSVWPVLGRNAEAHKVDLFGRFDMEIGGTFTHDASGMLPTLQSGYVYVASNRVNDLFPDIHNWSFGFYSVSNSANDTYGDMGSIYGSGKMSIQARNAAGNMVGYAGSDTLITGAVPSSLGLFWANRYKTPTVVGAGFYRNDTGIAGNSVVASGIPGTFTLCHVSMGYWGQRYHSFMFACPINQPDPSSMYNLVQALQTHCGRAV